MLDSNKKPMLDAERRTPNAERLTPLYANPPPRKSSECLSIDLRFSYASRKLLETILPAVDITCNK